MALDDRTGAVRFTGSRWELAGMLLRGYALMVPTIGIYRFWLTTHKRRFYWANTEIGGDALEYTGTATQLLLGFLMALAIFIPLYGLFFYLSTQSSEAAVLGYGAVALLLWYLAGYAIYRARDFRLSRTLWRGIRFDQGGSAWAYATRRFFWSILVAITAGLAYPFMAGNLWAYRSKHTWYGDRQFGFTGSWRQLARPFYVTYIGIVLVLGIGLGLGAQWGGMPVSGQPRAAGIAVMVAAALVAGLLFLAYRARELTLMLSSLRAGGAALSVRIGTGSLAGQYLLFALALVGTYIVLAIGGVVVLGLLAGDAFANGSFDMERFMGHMQGSFLVLAAIVFGYLLLLGAFSWCSELFLGLGFWKLVASNASISGLESLANVRARGEDRSLGGEGLADALNVGAY